MTTSRFLATVLSIFVGLTSTVDNAEAFAQTTSEAQSGGTLSVAITHNRYTYVDGVKIFYREAGPADAPAVFLPHGFPSSSYMFRNLIPVLADRYHVIAPDYPGFGLSAAPDHTTFAYAFAHYATLMNGVLEQLHVHHYAIYLFDYGAPVGYRLALKHPERVSALIVQNGNADAEGLQKFQYLHGVRDPSRVDPDTWGYDQPLLQRPGNKDIQLDLFDDYGSNVPLYPKFQQFFRERRPPTLIVWGANDFIFPAQGAYPYRRDLPGAEFHLIDSGHFLLEDRADKAFPLFHDFLDRKVAGTASVEGDVRQVSSSRGKR